MNKQQMTTALSIIALKFMNILGNIA